jgi:ribosome-associated protein
LTKESGKTFFMNYAVDITPVCDCYGWTDTPFVNSLGILASLDPVAIDKACIDLMNEAPGLINSEAEDSGALAPGAK